MIRDPKWIDLDEGCRIAGKDTRKALDRWIRRWNHDHLDYQIICIPKKVDEHSLRTAVRMWADLHTPGRDLRRQISANPLKSKNGVRQNERRSISPGRHSQRKDQSC